MAILQVPIVKAKTTLDMDTDKLPDEVYREFMVSGGKNVLGRGMSKVTKANYPDPEELKAAALAIAQDNLEKCYAGEIRITGASKATKKVAGAVMVEARRLARNIVKDALKAAGHKVSHIEARSITALANEYLDSEEGAGTIEEAKTNLEAREAKVSAKPKIDLSKVKVSESKVRAAADKAAKGKRVPAGIVNVKGRDARTGQRAN
jgi:hypothetical protein